MDFKINSFFFDKRVSEHTKKRSFIKKLPKRKLNCGTVSSSFGQAVIHSKEREELWVV